MDSSDDDFNILGKTIGEKEHSLTINEIPSHTHGTAVTETAMGAPSGNASMAVAYQKTDGFPTGATGGGQEHNNIQPSIVLNYIIKVSTTTSIQGEIVDSLDGNSTTNAPSIRAVNAGLLDKYSAEEQVIGTWFGKTLYRKTFYRQSLINGMDEIVNHGIQNVDKIWVNPSKSFAIWSNGTINPIPFIHPDNYANGIYVSDFSSTSYRIKSGMDRTNIPGYITLEYTKTTD